MDLPYPDHRPFVQHMSSKQRSGIKKVIEDLGRHALEIQAYRGTLIHRIYADPGYKVS